MKKLTIAIILLTIIIGSVIALLIFNIPSNSSKPISENKSFNISIVNAFPHLHFNNPVDLQIDNANQSLIYVVEQEGIIKSFINSPVTSSAQIVLNLTSKVLFGGEQGLLGLAFHPNFASNGLLYIDYTAQPNGQTIIAQFKYQNSVIDPNSEKIIIEISQPFTNHNAGQIMFGLDGYLYITLGDGGSGGDPQGNGQNLKTLLGSILRIDVDYAGNNLKYVIPTDNPFFNNSQGYRQEIYAFGLRNPWRLSQDPVTGTIWVGDVGQNSREEIDIIIKGKNYGWNIMEGFTCYNPFSNCNKSGLQEPVIDYGRKDGNAVTGGYVYRGSINQLVGNYIFGDYGSGKIWLINSSHDLILLDSTNFHISSFGVDSTNQLYFFDYSSGVIFTFKSLVNSSTKASIIYNNKMSSPILLCSVNVFLRTLENNHISNFPFL